MKNIIIYENDLLNQDIEMIINSTTSISVDTETTGLDPLLDELCVIQIRAGDYYFVLKYNRDCEYNNLIKIFESNKIEKIFHNAVFDLRFLIKNLNIKMIKNVKCTKIAAKLLLGPNSNTSLKTLSFFYMNIEMDKKYQKSNWKEELTEDQLKYAVNDVEYLEGLWKILVKELKTVKKINLLNECMRVLPSICTIKNSGFNDIFEY